MTAVTKQTIEVLWRKRPERGASTIKIPQVPGLDLYIAQGKATWRLDYRLPGVNPVTGKRWPGGARRLGDLRPDFHLPEAIAMARAWRVKIGQGIDPYLERKAGVTAQLVETAAAVRTVQTLVDAYKAARSGTMATGDGAGVRCRSAPDHRLPGHHAVAPGDPAPACKFFARVRRSAAGTRQARHPGRAHADAAGSLFGFAIDRDWIEISPAQRLPLPAQSTARSRTLSAEEIRSAWQALSTPQYGIGHGLRTLLKLSLVTGQRIGAVALTREPDLDLDGGQDDPDVADSGPQWIIRGIAGAKAEHDRVLPLSPLAVQLFRQALALPGRDPGVGYVFRGKKAQRPLAQPTISHAWVTLRHDGRVPAGTWPHDLRRTRRTWWPALAHGQEEHVLERILGHAVGSKVSRVYDRAFWLPQQRTGTRSVGTEARSDHQRRRPRGRDGPPCLSHACRRALQTTAVQALGSSIARVPLERRDQRLAPR